MTSIAAPRTTTPLSPRHPASTGLVGTAAFVAAMVAGEAFGLTNEAGKVSSTAGEWAISALITLAGLAVGVGVGLRAWRGSPARLSRTALGLAIAGALLFVVFWSGWPSIFSAVAVGLALEHRRRVGSFSPATGIAAGLGVVAFVAAAFFCLTG